MNLEHLVNWAKKEDQRIQKAHPSKDKEKLALRKMAKLTEEVGELSDAVLDYFKVQRPAKFSKSKEELEGEIADVIIVALILAGHVGVNPEKALTNKISKINRRRYK